MSPSPKPLKNTIPGMKRRESEIKWRDGDDLGCFAMAKLDEKYRATIAQRQQGICLPERCGPWVNVRLIIGPITSGPDKRRGKKGSIVHVEFFAENIEDATHLTELLLGRIRGVRIGEHTPRPANWPEPMAEVPWPEKKWRPWP